MDFDFTFDPEERDPLFDYIEDDLEHQDDWFEEETETLIPWFAVWT